MDLFCRRFQVFIIELIFLLNDLFKIIFFNNSTSIVPAHISISSNDRAYIVTSNPTAYELLALEVHGQPKKLWGIKFEDSTDISKAIVILKDQSVVFGVDNLLTRIDNEGKFVWNHTFEETTKIRNIALGYDNSIYIGLFTENEEESNTHLAAFDLDGEEIWNTFLEGDSIGGESPVVGESAVYYSSDTTFYAVNLDGSISWKIENENMTRILPAISHNGDVIILGTDGTLSIFDNNGNEIQKKKILRSICYSPVVDGLGNILVASGGCKYQDTHNVTFSYFDNDLNLIWESATGDGYTDNPQANSHPVILGDGSLQISSGAYYTTSPLINIKRTHGSVPINSNLFPLVLARDTNNTCVDLEMNELLQYKLARVSASIYYFNVETRKELGVFNTTNCYTRENTLLTCCISNKEIINSLKDIDKSSMMMKLNVKLKEVEHKEFTLNARFFSTIGIYNVSNNIIEKSDPQIVNITGFNYGLSRDLFCQFVNKNNLTETYRINATIINSKLASCAIPPEAQGTYCLEVSSNIDKFSRSCTTTIEIQSSSKYSSKTILIILTILLILIFAIIIIGSIHYFCCQKRLKDELDLLEIDNRIDEDLSLDNYDQLLQNENKDDLDFL